MRGTGVKTHHEIKRREPTKLISTRFEFTGKGGCPALKES